MRIIVILSILAFVYPLQAADPEFFEPWEAHSVQRQIDADRESTSPLGSLLIGSIRFYQDVISSVIGADCPMHPSCSAYGIEAIEKHGFFVGILMTADRLIHESDEISLGPEIETEGRLKVHDPVENNDFWWTGPKK